MSKPKVKQFPKNNSKILQFLRKDNLSATKSPVIKNSNINVDKDQMDVDEKINSTKKRKASEDEVDSKQQKKIHCDILKESKKLNLNKLDLTNSNNSLCISTLNEDATEAMSSQKPQAINLNASVKENENNRIKLASPTEQILIDETTSNICTILNIDFDTWNDDTLEIEETFTLDLTEPVHCKIININNFSQKVLLTLQSTKNNENGLCSLEGFWIYTSLTVGDTIYITSKKINGNWVVNDDYGLLVFEPDLLISSTSVVGSLWCKRRSLLSERFRGFDSTNKYMLVGNLVHNTLQYALKNNVLDTEIIKEMVKKFLVKSRTIKILYECDISLQWIEDEIMKYVPKIQEFMKVYVKNTNSSKLTGNKDDWKGTISNINDIEENIWCPELGIKGKIDVTVEVDNQIMPLELKTGKASISAEHRGQVLLYLMMMKRIGYNVMSGLLLYLKEGVIREITPIHREQRDLIRLRNELVYYLTKATVVIDNEKIIPPELPETINHISCNKCPYSTICTLVAHSTNEDLSSRPVLKKIQQDTLEYLSKSHMDYFLKWTCLLILESESSVCDKDIKEIYMTTPEKREKNGKCISNLKIGKISQADEIYCEHLFEKNLDRSTNLITSGIVESGYVVISTDKRHAVAAGFVKNITTNSITVSLERNLNKKYAGQTFCIDSYDSGITQSYNLSSLALLLDPTLRAESLRKIIIDKEPPTFKTTLPKLIGTKGKAILKRLNRVQQRAVLKALTANEYFLIKGMPGTGKTATIVALIQLLYELNKTVLITSHTNSAVDNVCLKLLQYNVKFIRLGSESRIHKDLLECSEHYLTKHCTSPEEYEAVYDSAQILAVTCMASGHPVLTKRTLDICIIDESTQVLQSSVIRPLYSCKTFILIGDPDQLPAVVKNNKAKDLGMSESLFERLSTENTTNSLNINYRMNSRITSLANILTYKGELQVGSESIANATLNLSNKKLLQVVYEKESWVLEALNDAMENAVQFLDTGPVWNLAEEVEWKVHKSFAGYDSQNDKKSKINIYEAAVIFKLVNALVKGGVEPENIGVIASYRHQVEQISSVLKFDSIDVNTVDQFQGKDKSVIIYSCGNSKDPLVFKIPAADDILMDKRRLTVAITRAKHKLIIIGDITTLMVYPSFKAFLSSSFESNIIRLKECEGFSWKNVLSIRA